jgi:hypothetical protein
MGSYFTGLRGLAGFVMPILFWSFSSLSAQAEGVSSTEIRNMSAIPGDTAASTTLTGRALDQAKRPVEFSSILLLRAADSSVVQTALTDTAGHYDFRRVRTGDYLIKAMQVGYGTVYLPRFAVLGSTATLELPALVLTQAAQQLGEVKVVGRKPIMERQLDRLVVHVDQMPAAAGGSVFDVLKSTPGVTITGNDAIGMAGKSGVLVLLNDRPVRLTAEALADMLKNMPAESVEALELITTPPAKYDAEGNAGLLNIRTRHRLANGWNTDLTLRVGQGQRTRVGAGVIANVKTQKLELGGSYSAGRNQGFQNIEEFAVIRDPGSLQTVSDLYSSSHQTNTARFHDLKTQLDYTLSKKVTVGLAGTLYTLHNPMQDRNEARSLLADAGPAALSTTYSNTANQLWNYSIDGYYTLRLDTLGTELALDANVAQFNTDKNQDFVNQAHSVDGGQVGTPQRLRSFLAGGTRIQSIKADFTKTWAGLKVETGAKISHITANNDFLFQQNQAEVWTDDARRTNQFGYEESIYAAYLSGSKTWGKVSVQLGLRPEYTRTRGQSLTTNTTTINNYLQLFPTAYVQYTPKAGVYQLTASYSRRIERPDFSWLNPFLSYQTPYFSNQGNPFLRPSFTQSLEFANLFKDQFTVTPFVNYTSQYSSEFPVENPATREITYTFGNIGQSYSYGGQFSAPLTFGPHWKADPSLTLFEQHFTSNHPQAAQHSRRFVYQLSLTNSFMLGPKVSAQLSGYYNSPSIQGFYQTVAYYSASAGVNLKLLQDQATLALSLGDIFFTERGDAYTHYPNQDFGFTRRNDTRVLRAAFTYKLGNKTLKAKQRHESAGQDELNRAR